MKRKSAIITGASRGIGKAIAEEFASRNYNLGLIARNKEELERVVHELEREYQGIYLPFECDIRNAKEIEKVFSEIHRKLSSIDILVNNAGINSRRTLNTKNLDNWFSDFDKNLLGWNDEIATNLTGTYICSYLAAGYMLKGGRGGSIINISSVKGKESTTSPGYGASKAGIIKLTKDFAKALAPKIRVNCIVPGFIDCGMTRELSDEKKEMYKEKIPLGRFGSVEEVAKTVVFLASADASYITGAVIDVNGGYFI